MSRADATFGRRLLVRWVDTISRASWAVVLLALLSAGAGLTYAVGHLGINTSTKDMLSEELPFRRNDRAMDQAFPQLDQQILIVVEADTPERAEAAAAVIAQGLAARPARFQSVFYPDGSAFFRRNGLLYLELSALEDLSDRLAAAQPMLVTLARSPTLGGLAELLALAAAGPAETHGDLLPALTAMAASVESLAAGRPASLSWQTLLSGADDDRHLRRKLIIVSPKLDFDSLAPVAPAIGELEAVLAELGVDRDPAVRVRITGEPVMLQDELASVRDGIGLVGLLSLLLVTALLVIGLRRLRLVVATLVTLLVGLCWTAAFAALAVGELNLISVAFAVLFIGLSVDFGIHFALRAEEERGRGVDVRESLRRAAAGVGGALALTAVAAAIGFLSFLPTSYRGLSELGLISGAGMFIALFANLTLLPALLALLPAQGAPPPAVLHLGRILQVGLERRAKTVAAFALLLALAGLTALPFAYFDDDPFNLRDPESPSVVTLLDILDDSRVEPYAASVLAEGVTAAAAMAERLRALPEVARAVTLADYVPSDQADKLALIEETAFFLAPLWQDEPAPRTADPASRADAFAALRQAVEDLRAGPASDPATRLAGALGAVPQDAAGLERLERALLETLPGRLEALTLALTAQEVVLEDLPPELVSRKVTADGRSTVDVYPAADLRDRAARQAFADAVGALAPGATGMPIITTAAGRAVTEAFLQAAGTAVLLITLLLLAILRSFRDSLLVLAPLFLAALLTVAATVLLAMPFNFANVIVLPLLFGLGVAAGIHMVVRSRDDDAALLHSCTPRAILFSALTTMGSFGALALSSHKGTASMGALLTIAIGLTMASCLIVLPALLALVRPKRG